MYSASLLGTGLVESALWDFLHGFLLRALGTVSVGGRVMDLETPSVIHRARPSFVTHSTRLSGALGQSATRMAGYARHAGQMPVDGEGGVADKVSNLRHAQCSHSGTPLVRFHCPLELDGKDSEKLCQT